MYSLLVTVAEDALNLGINELSGRLAVRHGGAEGKSLTGPQTAVARCQRNRTQLVAHAPSGHHLAGELCGQLQIGFSPAGTGAVHHLLGHPTSKGSANSCAQIS